MQLLIIYKRFTMLDFSIYKYFRLFRPKNGHNVFYDELKGGIDYVKRNA